ncbi:MAG: hypothetical protein H6974_01665 [Gammaproteobacteria bacterium]|nr:hypothetical protein [Gammaproteobacteria bacterium]MCP5195494.1 hypothetical protein [Gammaproteobacteria bacterium]
MSIDGLDLRRRSDSLICGVLGPGLFLLLICILFYPGGRSADTEWQYNEAKFGDFTDFHPPIMAYLWSLLLDFWLDRFSIQLLHAALFATGLGLLVSRFTCSGWQYALAFWIIAAWPSIIIQQAQPWKDGGMVGALMLAGGLISGRRDRLWRYSLILLALFYATAIRYNGVTVSFCLLWWRYYDRSPQDGWPRVLRSIVAASLTAGLLFSGSQLVNGWLTGSRTYAVERTAYIFDLSALSLATGEYLLPPHMRSRPDSADLEAIRRYFNPIRVSHQEEPRSLASHERQALRDAWLSAIWRHPGTWLSHRWRLFLLTIGIGDGAYTPYIAPAVPTDLQRWFFAKIFEALVAGFFQVWLYLLLLPVAAIWGGWRRHLGILFLALSGIFVILPLFVIAPSHDFRYSYWAVVACVTAWVWLIRDLSLDAPRGWRR